MRMRSEKLILAPTDLSNFLGCRHLSALDLKAAKGIVERPSRYTAVTRALQEKGIAHEESYLEFLRAQGLEIAEVGDNDGGLDQTLVLMRQGVDVIYQAPLADEHLSGYSDFLIKVPLPSKLGEWSYEATDTKLARDTRAGTIIQLCVYTYLVEKLQGVLPKHMSVVTPGNDFQPHAYRTHDYGAYFRLLRNEIDAFSTQKEETYPDLVSHCDYCVWWNDCEKRRRGDDHLCYVAGISSSQIKALRELGINSLGALAALEDVPKPSRGSQEALIRSRDQARIQVIGREKKAPYHEFREPFDEEHGLCLLPEPTPDDIFLDFEGNHFIEGGVQEYLTGWVTSTPDGDDAYTAVWAQNMEEEKRAFEQFMDMATETTKRNPGAHIYHYAPYEPAALKRLMGRYATCEEALDALLRGRKFVDLHSVVKRALIASVERYSIKDLEPFFGYSRQQDLREASASRRVVESAIEAGALDESLHEHRAIVEVYNREDCASTRRLRDWLEKLRTELLEQGHDLRRPEAGDDDTSDDVSELDQRLHALRDALLETVPVDPAGRSLEQQAQFVLAHMMEFHRREDKAVWWEYFRLLDLDGEEFADERRAITGLEFVEVVLPMRAPLQRFRFPPQELDARAGDGLFDKDQRKIGTVDSVNYTERTIDIKKMMATADERPTDLILYKRISADVIRESLIRLGETVLSDGFVPRDPYRSCFELLLRQRPAAAGPDGSLEQAGETTVATARRLAADLDGSALSVQGPPGTGKTFTGGEIVCELIKLGKKVGVTAVSHRVVVNLLEGAMEAAEAKGIDIRCVHRDDGEYEGPYEIRYEKSYDSILAGLADGTINLLGGTAWQWAKPEFQQTVDVLIVDEAGQMALSNVLAVAPSGNGLVLLGDPQQLEQPLQCNHPEGTDVSALYHVLDGEATMPPDLGLFLGETWRLHPELTAFTSEVYYQGRLTALKGLEHQAIIGPNRFSGSGLLFVPVAHRGNQARSIEEAAAIEQIVGELLSAGTTWCDRKEQTHKLTQSDILIVAPYNAQVATLAERLPNYRIGTVDKFQGQEAPIVIYSMTSSSPEDAPRGMEFLYNRNRFNVATSRARAICILVGSPSLFEPNCKSPRQMRMANGFCRYLELAEVVEL